MINERDVIRIKIPYPNIVSDLAVSSHMYICKKSVGHHYEYIKCQTLKPYMLVNKLFKHYVDENADISRNPFQHTTRIDCDKLFSSDAIQYDDGLKTIARPDVCEELYKDVIAELESDGYEIIKINETQMTSINPMVTKV